MNELEAFGITREALAPMKSAARSRFLAHYGWGEEVLARYGIMIYEPEEGPWLEKYRYQLDGHRWADIPYLDVDGRPLWFYAHGASTETQFRRARKLDYKKPLSGKDLGKYAQYADSSVRLYLPHDMTRPDYWRLLANDVTQPIVLTEGEFDAISAHYRGIPCIGLGGLDSFMIGRKDTQRPTVAQPGEQIQWKDREVFIVPDQDPESSVARPFKPSVSIGCGRLAIGLRLLGAKPFYLKIRLTPTGEKMAGRKVGLSEYFAEGGTWRDLVATKTAPTAEDDVLLGLLDTYAMAPDGVLSLVDGKTVRFHSWELLNAPLKVHYEVDGKPRSVPATRLWLEHPLRATVECYVMDPLKASGYLPQDKAYNMWKGFGVDPLAIPEEDTVEWAQATQVVEWFNEYGEKMWGSELWPWVRGCIAHMIQKPEALRQHALILQSRQTGIGKSAFFKLIGGVIGQSNFIVVSADRFFSNFNSEAASKLLVLFDEAHIVSRSIANALKEQVTSETIRKEAKGVDAVTIPWRGLFCLATNEAFAIPVSKEERRYCQSTPVIPPTERASWQARVQEILSLLTEPESLRYLLGYLMWPDLVECYDPRQDAPRSASLEESAMAGMSQREWLAHRLYAELPNVFAFTPGLRGGSGEAGGVDKYTIDGACAMAASRAYGSVRLDGRITNVTLYSKDGRFPLPVVERGNGQRQLVKAVGKPGVSFYIKEALSDTFAKLIAFKPFDASVGTVEDV